MPDTFTLTIIFLLLCALIGAYLRGRSKDRCLENFSKNPVILEFKDGKNIWGRAFVANSGIEFSYEKPFVDGKYNHTETTYILYKNEYDRIFCVVRALDDLSDKELNERNKALKNLSKNVLGKRFFRGIRNFFGTIRDSIIEMSHLFLGKVKALPAGAVLKDQDKYVKQINSDVIASIGTSYEPLLERYLGKKVVFSLVNGDTKIQYSGILRDYTSEFISIMDVEYKCIHKNKTLKTDLVIPRSVGIIRHLGQ